MLGLHLLLPAKAALAQTKGVAVYVDGPDASRVREAVLEAVGSGPQVADDKVFRAELARAGQKKPFGKELDPKSIARIRKAGIAVGAEAVLVVRARRDKKSRWVLLILVDVAEGPAPTEKVRLDLKSHEKDSDEIAAALGHSLDKYAPQPEPLATPPPETAPASETAPAPQPTEVKTSSTAPGNAAGAAEDSARTATPVVPKTPAQLVATSLLDLAVGAEASGRRFAYGNGISPARRVYWMFPAPTVSVSGKVFPLATVGGPWGDIGIAVDYSRTFLQAGQLNGALANTVPTSYAFSLCVRVHPGSSDRVLVGASFGYAYMSFGSVGPPNAESPDVTYRSLRPALDGRVSFGNFSILAGAALRAIVDADTISTRFYSPRGYGFDGQLGGAFMFIRRLEARLVARYEHYSFAFTPPAGVVFGPGDAQDQLYGARMSVAFVF